MPWKRPVGLSTRGEAGISIIHPDNIRSRRVVRKNGLWFERTRFFAGILYKFLPPTCKEKPGGASQPVPWLPDN
ncbi:MAG: hypothetical protein M0Z65_08475 [Firmicutes bacterium]|nr:hypothetical protein [Bacillota bacterium]